MISQKRPGRDSLKLCDIHSGVPQDLVLAYREVDCNQHQLARRLGVNDFYLNQLLRKGIEPSNPDIRERLFLPRVKKKPRIKREPKPELFLGQNKIKRQIAGLARQTRESVLLVKHE